MRMYARAAVGRRSPNAEPADEFAARVRAGIERIAAAHADELVVAVVHGGVIGQVMNLASGTTGFRFNGADNASIHHIVVDRRPLDHPLLQRHQPPQPDLRHGAGAADVTQSCLSATLRVDRGRCRP